MTVTRKREGGVEPNLGKNGRSQTLEKKNPTEILPITAYGASEKIGIQKNNDICGFESLRLLRSQETANTVFADLERLRMLQITAL